MMKVIGFVGASGCGKSFFMKHLDKSYPYQFCSPIRYTTRPARKDDEADGVCSISLDEFQARDGRGEWACLNRQSADPNSTLSAYRKTDLLTDEGPLPLIFVSVFDVAEARKAIPGLFVVHIKADWTEGLKLRGDTAEHTANRHQLNSSLEQTFEEFTDYNLLFTHSFSGETAKLMSALVRAKALSPVDYTPGVLLRNYFPLVAIANVRGLDDAMRQGRLPPLASWEVVCDESVRGQMGDVILGDVHKKQSQVDDLMIYDSTAKAEHCSPDTLRVLCPLGNRESSTHVNGGIPDEGLILPTPSPTADNILWQQPRFITPNSGLVGVLFADGAAANPLAESSTKFTAHGLLRLPGSNPRIFNVRDLAVQPSISLVALNRPIIVIGATSAEAGKTTLTCKLIKHLTDSGIKLAGIKATGTGGIQDSAQHIQAGAFLALDQVNSGIPTTYIDPTLFLQHIPSVFLECQEQGAKVILCELGGDICWANNPALLKAEWLQRNLARMFVIANDSLAMVGAKTWIEGEVGGALEGRLSFVSSPFRNWRGAVSRAAALQLPTPFDPNDVETIAHEAMKSLKAFEDRAPKFSSASAATLDVSAGQMGLIQDYWEASTSFANATPGIPASSGTEYNLKTSANFVSKRSDDEIEVSPLRIVVTAVHRHAKNFAPDATTEFILGCGARQLMNASLSALYTHRCCASNVPTKKLLVYSPAPYYVAFERALQFQAHIGTWCSCAPEFLKASSEEYFKVIMVSSPCNPTGKLYVPSGDATECLQCAEAIIVDASYAWPHLSPDAMAHYASNDAVTLLPSTYTADHPVDVITLFSLSKLTSHAMTRIGWAWTGNPNLAAEMRRFIRFHTIGISLEAEHRALHILQWLSMLGFKEFDRMWKQVSARFFSRWTVLQEVLENPPRGVEVIPVPGWCYLNFRIEDDAQRSRFVERCTSSHIGLIPYTGEEMGDKALVRFNIGVREREFGSLLAKLKALLASQA